MKINEMLKILILLLSSSVLGNVLGALCPCEDQSLCKPVNYSGKEVTLKLITN